jgi:hypothetical protein
MRIDFDQSVPVAEQLVRTAAFKKPGRKHQKRKGARAKEKCRATAKRRIALKATKAAKFHAAVSAYWRGERDTHPMTPNMKWTPQKASFFTPLLVYKTELPTPNA